MINAIGIITNSLTALNENILAKMQANSLFGVESYAISLSGINDYFEKGYVDALKWENGQITECHTDFPKYVDIIGSVSAVKRNCPEIYFWLKGNTVVLDEQATDKYWLQKRMMASELSCYAIPTFQFEKYETLLTFLSAIPKAIIKPKGGRKATGLMSLDVKDDTVYYKTRYGSGVLTEELFLQYKSEIKEKVIFLFEPRLNLLSDDGRAVDFRCLVARNGKGEWENVLTYARIGGSSVASNFSGGGSLNLALDVLEQIVPGQENEKLAEINEVALKVAAFVQKNTAVHNCRLGIDVCIDRDTNRVYVIEANSKPGVKLVGPWPLALTLAQYYKYVLENGDCVL